MQPFSTKCSWFRAANLTRRDQKLFLSTQVLGQTAALQQAVLLVPSRKRGRTCAKIVLQKAVLLVPCRKPKPGRTCAKICSFLPRSFYCGPSASSAPGSERKPGRTCAKIVYFNRGSGPCSPSAPGAPGSGPDLFTKRPF